MVLFRPPPRSRERLGFAVSKLVTLGFAVALSAVAYRYGGGVTRASSGWSRVADTDRPRAAEGRRIRDTRVP
jgi:hypothetical protein